MLGRYDDLTDDFSSWDESPVEEGLEGTLSDRVREALEAEEPTANQERLARLVQGLTPKQFEAATFDEQALLVLAGAGTGKTRMLTVRIALLVTAGMAMPSEILAMTFTNKAAKEMKDRIAALLDLDAVSVQATTFHAFCARMVRDYGGEIGWKTDWTILADDDIKKMMRNVYKAEFGAPPEADFIKGAMNAYDEKTSDSTMTEARWETFAPEVRRVCDLYEAQKQADNVKDFSDLITDMVTLLKESETVRQEIRQRFKYVLVDEYQDTDARQEELLRLIMGDNRNLTVVGDEDQLVYSWRYAQIDNILGFCERWDAHLVMMEQNFRSKQIILTAANTLIGFNSQRIGKELYTFDDDGDPIDTNVFENPYAEADWIVARIKADIAAGVPREQIAVLVRASHALNMIEQALNHEGIRYTLSGGRKFQDRQEIKDVSAYLRLVANAHDRMAFERAIAAPKRGVAEGGIEVIDQAAKRMRTDVTDAAYRMAIGGILPEPAREPVAEFARFIWDLAGDAMHGADKDGRPIGAEHIVNRIVEETGYGQAIRDELAEAEANNVKEDVEALNTRLSNLNDLVNIAKGKTLHEFLDHLGLTEANRRDEGKGVWIGTIHAAKGLEFYNVYLPAWEMGVLPSNQTLKNGEGIEEERRLGYVAITRARRRLCITRSETRFNKGKDRQPSLPSIFLADLGVIPRPAGPEYEIVPVVRPVSTGSAIGSVPGGAKAGAPVMWADDEDVPF